MGKTLRDLCYAHGYPYGKVCSEVSIGKSSVSIVGVQHHVSFFHDYRLFFQDLVARSDALVLEGGRYLPQAEGRQPEFFLRLLDLVRTPSIPYYDADSHFAVGRGGLGMTDIVDLGLSFAPTTAVSIASSALLPSAINDLGDGVQMLAVASVGIAATMACVLKLPVGFLSRMDDHALVTPPFNKRNAINMGIDYRDWKTARGVKRIVQERPDLENVTIIYGAPHARRIAKYLSTPAPVRDRIYELPRRILEDFEAMEFRHDGTKWGLAASWGA